MKIIKYNAICNLGFNIKEIFAKAINGEAGKFEQRDFARLGIVDCPLPEISESDYNLRCNRLLLKALEPLNIEELDRDKTAIVVATSNSGVDEYEISGNPKHYQIGNPAEFLYKHFGFKNFYTSVSTACSSGIKAFAIASELLESNIAENIIVAGCDSISKVPVYGFHALEVLGNVPSNPFSKNRKWINIGEGAAAFVVKNEGEGIEVAGIGETTDFYHSTTPDPEAVEPEQAIRLALGGMSPDEVDYINLHGTGTVANDLMEARAIYNVFGDSVPASSTKPLTGHCLGAAASIETALCCALLDNFSTPLPPSGTSPAGGADVRRDFLAFQESECANPAPEAFVHPAGEADFRTDGNILKNSTPSPALPIGEGERANWAQDTLPPLRGKCPEDKGGYQTSLTRANPQEHTSYLYPHIYDGEYDLTLPVIKLADKKLANKLIKTCLCTSFGFGGTNCAIVLTRKLTENNDK